MCKSIFLVLVFLLMTLSSIIGQNVSTLWPYLYEDFQDGRVLHQDGSAVSQKLNIHVLKEKLHFLKGDAIFEADLSQVIGIEIADESYLCVDGRMLKVIATANDLVLLYSQKGDFDALFNAGGAYGSSSSSSSVQKLSSIEIGGVNSMSHMYLKQNKSNSSKLGLKTEYYFFHNGKLLDANRKSFETLLSETQNNDFKLFLKSTKVKWNDGQGLTLVLSFWNDLK